MPHLFVTYDEHHGWYNTSGRVVIPFAEDEEPREAIHAYFSGFYHRCTETLERGREYKDDEYQRMLCITGYNTIPPEEAETVEKYVTTAHRGER